MTGRLEEQGAVGSAGHRVVRGSVTKAFPFTVVGGDVDHGDRDGRLAAVEARHVGDEPAGPDDRWLTGERNVDRVAPVAVGEQTMDGPAIGRREHVQPTGAERVDERKSV